jgi:predicted O-methyltransferase YrrM
MAADTLAERIEREFGDGFLGGRRRLDEYRREVQESRLVEHLQTRYEEYWKIVDPSTRYNTGRVGYEEGVRLYALVRALQPSVAVETGVCNGFSTAFLLLALQHNGCGALHSIDLPEVAGVDYEPGTFWEGKGGAAIPPGKESGWMIPDELQERWTLVLGMSYDELPPLLERLGTIDFFIHDSEHSYECMSFEFARAWDGLGEGGVVVADDAHWNTAFAEFAARIGRTPIALGKKLEFVQK